MTQDNLISTDLQSLEVSESFVDLFELEYSDTTTLYFHSGVSTTVRILKVSADYNTITLNTPQTLADNSALVLTGLNRSTGVAASINATVNGAVSNSQTVVIDNKTGATTPATGWPAVPEAGMVVTGTDIKNDEYGEVVFNKNVYYGFPIGIDGIDIASDGAHSRPTLTIANVESLLRTSSTFQNAFDTQRAEAAGATGSGISGFKLDNLVGKKVTRRRTLEKYLQVSSGRTTDAASATDIIELPKSVFIIDRISSKTNIMAIMELSSPFDLSGLRVPRREVVGKYCSWVYKGKKEYSTSALSGTVYINSGELTLRGTGSAGNWTTDFTKEISVGDEIIIDGKYIRKVTNIGTANADVEKSQLTVARSLPIITNDGGSASSGTEPGPLSFAKVIRRNKGACSWAVDGAYKPNAISYKVYYTVNDEPIIFRGITHTWNGSAWVARTSSDSAIATGTAVLTDGAVISGKVTAGGSGYTSAPTATIAKNTQDTGSGSGATATCTRSLGGAVTSITITNRGSGYSLTYPPTITFSGGGGNGATGTLSVANGVVTGVNVTSAGAGYTTVPSITFTGTHSGASATATAVLGTSSNSDKVASVTMTNGGSTYTSSGDNKIGVVFERPPTIAPVEWESDNEMPLTQGDVVYTTEDGDQLFWLYMGSTGTVTTPPTRTSILWEAMWHYDGWTDRAYTINSKDALRNDYVLHPMSTWGTRNAPAYTDTSTVYRNTVSMSASSGNKPSADSLFWAPGDSCGKLLMSCKKRYQFIGNTLAGTDELTVPSPNRNTNIVLPFGGFPGSRKFR